MEGVVTFDQFIPRLGSLTRGCVLPSNPSSDFSESLERNKMETLRIILYHVVLVSSTARNDVVTLTREIL